MSETLTSTKTILPDSWGGEMRALLTIGIPMALAQLVQFSPYVADTLMIGRIGPEEIAAAAIGSVLYFLLWMLASGPIAAVTPLVSQALGRDKTERRDVRRTVRMSVWACFLLFPLIVGLLLMTEPIMILAGQDPQVAALAQGYVLVLAPGLPFTLAVMSFRNFLATIERTIIPFLLVASAALVNIALNWVLIFGNLGAPEMGLIGAGIASSIACIYSFFAFVIYIKWDSRARDFDLFSNLWKPDWERMRGLTILASVLAIGIFALPVALTPDWVASFYFNMESAETRPVFDYVVLFLPLAAGFMFFDAVQVAANQLLRGLADVLAFRLLFTRPFTRRLAQKAYGMA